MPGVVKKVSMPAPRRVMRARIFSIIGLISIICMFGYFKGQDTVGSVGLILFMLSIFTIGLTGVFQVFSKPSDEFERAKANQAASYAYAVVAIAIILFIAAVKLVAGLGQYADASGVLGSGYLGAGLYQYYHDLDRPAEFWGDILLLASAVLIFIPPAILAWLMPVDEIAED